jgi:hypothetical protein
MSLFPTKNLTDTFGIRIILKIKPEKDLLCATYIHRVVGKNKIKISNHYTKKNAPYM